MHKDIKTKLPISIKNIDHILERVYERYPFASKYDIAIIVKEFFETIRSVLITGNSISISNFVSKIKLISFKRNNYNIIKAKISTPKKIKNAKL